MLAFCVASGCTADRAARLGNAPDAAAGGTQATPANPGYLSQGPALSGARLHIAPGETASERAVELSKKLAATQDEKKALAMHIQQLEGALEDKDKALLQASGEVQATQEELSSTRAELERWRQEMGFLREKLRSADRENLLTLQTTVSLLQHLLGQDEPSGPALGQPDMNRPADP